MGWIDGSELRNGLESWAGPNIRISSLRLGSRSGEEVPVLPVLPCPRLCLCVASAFWERTNILILLVASIMPSRSDDSSSSPILSRLNNLSNQIMASTGPSSFFTADLVPQAPEDPLFGLMAAYRRDTFDKKVDLGIGAYRDNNAKPWVLPVVKKVGVIRVDDSHPLITHYRPMRSCAATQVSTTNIFP